MQESNGFVPDSSIPADVSPVSVMITHDLNSSPTDSNRVKSIVDFRRACMNETKPLKRKSQNSRKRPFLHSSPRKKVRFLLLKEDSAASNSLAGGTMSQNLPRKGTVANDESDDHLPARDSTWLSQEEMSLIIQETRRYVIKSKKQAPNVFNQVGRLFQTCRDEDFSAASYIKSHCPPQSPQEGGSSQQDGRHSVSSTTTRAASSCPRFVTKTYNTNTSSLPSAFSSLRGLESCLDNTMVDYRAFHVRSLLKIQAKLPPAIIFGDIVARDTLLRRRSLHTSRGARNFARILGHLDSLEVVSMLQEELRVLGRRLEEV